MTATNTKVRSALASSTLEETKGIFQEVLVYLSTEVLAQRTLAMTDDAQLERFYKILTNEMLRRGLI